MIVGRSKFQVTIIKKKLFNHKTYFTLTTLYVVAPLTYKFVIFIFSSGPVICIKSINIGSICGVTYPCPKSPLARLDLMRSSTLLIHASGPDELEHGCMTLAVFRKIKSRLSRNIFLCIFFYH